MTYFTEISDCVTSLIVGQCHDVKQEGFNVVVQGLVVEEEFRQQTQVLAILLLSFSIHLPHAQVLLSVNLQDGVGLVKQLPDSINPQTYLIAGWMPPNTLGRMPFHADLRLLISQTELAQVQFR